MNTIGQNIKITFFGESHGSHIGIVIDNLPAGLKIDEDLIKFNLSKRRPAKNISTTRVEADHYQIISGFYNGFTTGGALTFLIKNTNTHSIDYKNLNQTPRPSHADYPAYIKYNGYNDFRGGGFFSGRLTALWIIVGSISEQILKKRNIIVGSHIYSLKNIEDVTFNMNDVNYKQLEQLNLDNFPVIDSKIKTEMLNLIENTKENKDAVGGIIESKIINLPVGLGEPYFLSFESYISQLLFSIPAIKGVEFGKGFEITRKTSSEINDEYIINSKKVSTASNNNGGILGGLTNGRPILIKTAVKPTPSIAKAQNTVNLDTLEETKLEIVGRHDPQIVSRAIHVVNAALNFACLDFLLFSNKKDVLS
ncbi:chorismate synthase [Mycoplasmatota bacterium WC30]